MKLSHIMLFGAALVVVFVLVYTLDTSGDNYAQGIIDWREQQLKSLTVGEEPILRPEDSISLDFYAIDKKYQVTADFKKAEKYETRDIVETDGSKVGYVLFGELSFEIDDQPLTLTLFQDLNTSTKYLLPFKDLSNGGSTYGAGRMLPVKVIGNPTEIELDFNRAFNPYCAYNEQYICPLTPLSNRLNVRIDAGEKAPVKASYE